VVVGEEKGAEIVLGNVQWTNVQQRQEEGARQQQDDADDGEDRSLASDVSEFWDSSSDSSSFVSEDSAEGWLRRSPLIDLEANLGEFWSQLSSSGESDRESNDEESRPAVVTV
jgi:hypothetical protein